MGADSQDSTLNGFSQFDLAAPSEPKREATGKEHGERQSHKQAPWQARNYFIRQSRDMCK
jgi:hypothetical protein